MRVCAKPDGDELPDDLESAIAPLGLLDDAVLWRVGRSTFLPAAAHKIEGLHFKRQHVCTPCVATL